MKGSRASSAISLLPSTVAVTEWAIPQEHCLAWEGPALQSRPFLTLAPSWAHCYLWSRASPYENPVLGGELKGSWCIILDPACIGTCSGEYKGPGDSGILRVSGKYVTGDWACVQWPHFIYRLYIHGAMDWKYVSLCLFEAHCNSLSESLSPSPSNFLQPRNSSAWKQPTSTLAQAGRLWVLKLASLEYYAILKEASTFFFGVHRVSWNRPTNQTSPLRILWAQGNAWISWQHVIGILSTLYYSPLSLITQQKTWIIKPAPTCLGTSWHLNSTA